MTHTHTPDTREREEEKNIILYNIYNNIFDTAAVG